MIVAAIIAVRVKDLLSSVIAVGAVGVGLSMAFLVLKAPDLAMMQLVVEILSLIMLIRATVRDDLPFSTSGRWLFNTSSTALFLAIFLACAYISLKELPAFGSPIMKVSGSYLEEGFARAGIKNMVASITLHYRVYDMLGEVAVIFAAIIGVLAVVRKVSENKDE